MTFDTLKEVRAIEKRILPAEPLLTALDELIRDLEQAGDHLLEANDGNKDARVAVHQSLEELRKEALSYINQGAYLQKRVQLTAQSVLDSLIWASSSSPRGRVRIRSRWQDQLAKILSRLELLHL